MQQQHENINKARVQDYWKHYSNTAQTEITKVGMLNLQKYTIKQ